MASGARRYTDREMAVLLRLATEMESKLPAVRSAVSTEGRTLDEIEEIAAGAGITPESIRAAAVALESDSPGFLARVLGGPTIFRIERHVPVDVASADLLDLAASARWTLAKEGGEVSSIPDGVG